MEQYDEARQTPAAPWQFPASYQDAIDWISEQPAAPLPVIRQYVGVEVCDSSGHEHTTLAVGMEVWIHGYPFRVVSQDTPLVCMAETATTLAMLRHSSTLPDDDRECWICTSLGSKAALARVDFS